MRPADSDPIGARLERVVALARAAGFAHAADALEERLNCAYTTSSEYLGEIGLAVRRFDKSVDRRRLPDEAQRLLSECRAELGIGLRGFFGR